MSDIPETHFKSDAINLGIWFIENPEPFIFSVVGAMAGIFISLKFIAPKMYGAEARAMKAKVDSLEKTICDMKRDHESRIQRLVNDNERVLQRLRPFENRLNEIALEQLLPKTCKD